MCDHTIESGNSRGNNGNMYLQQSDFHIPEKKRSYFTHLCRFFCVQNKKTFSQESAAVLYILRFFEWKTLWTIKTYFFPFLKLCCNHRFYIKRWILGPLTLMNLCRPLVAECKRHLTPTSSFEIIKHLSQK